MHRTRHLYEEIEQPNTDSIKLGCKLAGKTPNPNSTLSFVSLECYRPLYKDLEADPGARLSDFNHYGLPLLVICTKIDGSANVVSRAV